MQKTIFNQAIATVRGELVQDSDRLALLTDDGLIDLEAVRRRSLPLTVGMCVIARGYPRFSPKTKKLQSLAIIGCGFSIERSPGNMTVAGRIFASGDGQTIIQVTPRLMDAFFVPLKGYLPDVKEGEYWRLQCVLEAGLVTLVNGEKLKDAYVAPRLKRKHNAPKLREKVAA